MLNLFLVKVKVLVNLEQHTAKKKELMGIIALLS